MNNNEINNKNFVKNKELIKIFILFILTILLTTGFFKYYNNNKYPPRKIITNSVIDSDGKLIYIIKEMPSEENNNRFRYFVCYNSNFCGVSGNGGINDHRNEVDEKIYLETQQKIFEIKAKNIDNELKEATKNLNRFKETNNK